MKLNNDLIVAVESGSSKDIKDLFDLNHCGGEMLADVNFKGEDDWAPLHIAVSEANISIM